MTQKAYLAATVVLLRPAERRGFEVLLTHRPDSMAFQFGTYCFPGGTLRKEDFSEAMLRRARGITPEQAQKNIGAEYSPRRALGLWIAAIRELHEEAGILFAVNGAGESVLTRAQPISRPAEKHPCLLGNTINFLALLESEGLFCDLTALAHFSHWQTPARASLRFDSHFFLASVPGDCPAPPRSSEMAQSVWLTPDKALRMFNNNELPMMLPTFASLRTLADYDSLASVLKEYPVSKS